MYNRSSNPTISNCSFQTNSAVTGGGMYNASSNPSLTNCSFQTNSAQYAGGMFNYISSPTVANCSFISNSAQSIGGGMYNNGVSSPSLTNCSFQTNSAQFGGGMYNTASSNPTLSNCVLFGNGGGNTIVNSNASSLTASYSLFDNTVGNYSGSNNLTTTTSPFVSTTTVALNACSPAINAGNPTSVTTASGPYSTTALPATDLGGNPRIVGGRVDMGTHEFQGLLLSGPIWTGCVSRDWNTAGNWASGTVPTASDSVVIPSGATSQPIIGAGTLAVVHSVKVESGASLSFASGGSLTLR